MADRVSESGFDLDQVDRLLTTTRAVRKRLDLERWVGDDVIFECIDLAEQALPVATTPVVVGWSSAIKT